MSQESNENEDGKKRKREDSTEDSSPNKERKLNKSTGSFNLSPIHVSAHFIEPKTPDTQPGEEYENTDNKQSVKKLTPEEEQELIKYFLENAAQLKANQLNLENNLFSLELCNIDFFELPSTNQDEIINNYCEAIQENRQIEALSIYCDNGLTPEQIEKLISAIKSPHIKSIELIHMKLNTLQEKAKFFESAVIENPHLECVNFSTYNFDIFNTDGDFTKNFEHPQNIMPFFKQPNLKKIYIKINVSNEINFIYELLKAPTKIQRIVVDCDNIDSFYIFNSLLPSRLGELGSIKHIYETFNVCLKSNFTILELKLTNNSLFDEYNESHNKIFNLLLKRNNEINQFPENKNLICHFYAQLDDRLGEKPTEPLSENQQNLFNYLTSKVNAGELNLNNFTIEELKLWDSLCDTQAKFLLAKLNESYEKPNENISDTFSERQLAKSKFDAAHENSMALKTALLKKSQQLKIASQIGKDMYSSSQQPPQNTTSSEKDPGSSSKFSALQ